MADAGTELGTSRLLRQRSDGHEQATAFELFFDLVYVFAITQIASLLYARPTLEGAAQALLVLLAVWWAWNYTTWMTNWFDPRLVPVRIVLLAVMLLSLLMAVSIPDAFGELAPLFAISYVASQVLRNAFNVWAVPRGSVRWQSFVRILAWSLLAGACWIAGSVAGGHEPVTWLWLVALAVDYAGPIARYWTPGLGAASTADWDVDAHHFAERFQLLVIIALGEGIVVIGSSVAVVDVTAHTVAALASGFIATACMWWLYFDYVAEAAQGRLAAAGSDVGRLARDGFTYIHLPIIAGIIAFAVSLKFVIKHPTDALAGAELAIVLAGPLLYVGGHNLFRRRIAGSYSGRRWVAIGALLLIVPFNAALTSLAVSFVVAAVLAVLSVWESVAIRRWYRDLSPGARPPHMRHLARHVS